MNLLINVSFTALVELNVQVIEPYLSDDTFQIPDIQLPCTNENIDCDITYRDFLHANILIFTNTMRNEKGDKIWNFINFKS